MKKRVKIIAAISSLCLCLSLLVAGIFAATTVTFSVTSSLSFQANGAFVKVVGELKQGSSVADATAPSGTSSSYTAYSYNRESGSDVPDGSKPFANFTNPTWTIGDITFTEEKPLLIYDFTFTNYSPVPVLVTVSGVTPGVDGSFYVNDGYSNGRLLSAYAEGSGA